MHFEYTPYLIPAFLAAAAALTITPYTWWHRDVRGAAALGILTSAAAVWIVGYALELSGSDLPTKMVWYSLEYLGIAAVPVAWFVFSLHYTRQRQRLTRQGLVLLCVIPALTVVLALTNEAHHLMWADARLVNTGSFVALDVTFQLMFWVHAAYSYLLLIWGTLILVGTLLRMSNLYRLQAGIVVVAVAISLVTNLLWLLNISPVPYLDLTPFAVVVSSLMLGAVLFRFRLVDLVPLAREVVIEYMHDGMLVLDTQNRVLDCNPVAQQLLGIASAELLGSTVQDILPGCADVFKTDSTSLETQCETVLNGRRCELRLSPLADRRGRLTGRLLVLHDVTENRQAQEALRRSQVQLAAIIDTAQDAVITLDADLRIVMFNSGAERIFGRRADEVLGQTLDPFIPERARQAHPDYIRAFAQTGESTRGMGAGHVAAVRAGGEEFPAEASISRVVVDGASLFTVILRDVSERLRAEEAVRTQKVLFENLVAVARATSEKPDLEDTLRNVLRIAVSLTAAARGSLFLFDANGAVTHTVSVRDGAPIEERRNLIGQVMSHGLIGWVTRNRRPTLVVDTHADERWLTLGEELIPTRAALAVPIVGGQVLLGALILMHPEVGHFVDEHMRVMQAAADQMALAVRNARTFDVQRRMVKQQTTLYEVLRMIGSKLDRDAVARTAAEAITLLAGWPKVAIVLPDEDNKNWIVRAVSGSLPITIGLAYPIGQGIIGRAFRTGKTQIVNDVSTDADYLFTGSPTHSNLAVPLRRGERVLGVLNIESNVTAAFDSDDLSLAQSLADAVALALDNAELYQAIADERSRLQALITSSRDGIALLSLDRHVLVINEAALRLLGVPGTPDVWLGRTIYDAARYHRRSAPQLVDLIRREMRRIKFGNEPAADGEYQMYPYTVHWYNLPVTTGETPVGRLIVLRDVTEEQLLIQLRDDLTNTMVHDLRNPLSIIRGSLELLENELENQVSDTQRQVLAVMGQGVERMLSLVTSILDVNRLESGQMPLDREPALLRPLVEEVVEVQGVLARDKQLDLFIDIDTSLLPVSVDVDLIQRVFQNLIGNAIKFTPPGGTIRVGARSEPDDGHMVIVSISDTGPGISPDIQSHLFQRFVRGRDPGRGSGLGLAFCRLAIEAHGGRIWLETEASQGTGATFKFTLSTVI
jgi:NtrC-family two-component system sensor histidine kinase KinB